MRDPLDRRARRAVLFSACVLALGVSSEHVRAAADEPVLLEVKRFVIEGPNPLSERETEAVLKPYLGPHRSLETLESAAAALQTAIRDQGLSFHRVIVPAQQPSSGNLTLRVLPFMLGDINVVGNKSFSADNIRRSVPGLKPGVAPNLPKLSQQITLANEHASKRVTLQIKEGARPDTVDADLRVVDVPPQQFFAGLIAGTSDVDNSINENTGYTRLTVGYQHSNLFDLDHTITVAYTTSPDHLSDVKQYGLFYTAPLYGYNTMLTAYYTKSDINSGVIGIGTQSFGVSGVGEFYGLKAVYALPKLGDYSHNIYAAVDQRYFESNISFAGTPLPPSTVGSRPVTVGYGIRTERSTINFNATAEYVTNLAGGRSNNDAAYTAARAGSTQEWEAVRLGVDASYPLPARWTFKARARAQFSPDALIPGEQLGLAGLTAVRGFREREVTGDSGYFANLEAHGPTLLPGLTPFAFYDQGARHLKAVVPGVPSHEFISSTGAGVRWQWRRLEVSALWAYTLNGVGGATTQATDSGHHKGYLSAFYRF